MRARLLFLALPLSLLALPAQADEAAAKTTYQTYCLTCHGTGGQGDGPVGKSLTPSPRDFSDADYMRTRSDEQLTGVIVKGGAANNMSPIMPAWGPVLEESMINDLVAYIRAFAKTGDKPEEPKPDAPAPAPDKATDSPASAPAQETTDDKPSVPASSPETGGK